MTRTLAIAIAFAASLFALALIVCFAPNWRVCWALWPFFLSAALVVALGNEGTQRDTATKPKSERQEI